MCMEDEATHPFEFLNRAFDPISDVRPGVVVLQKNAISPFLKNYFVVSVQLLNAEFRIKCLITLKQFLIMPSQSHHTHNMVFRGWRSCFARRVAIFFGAKPLFSLLHINVKASVCDHILSDAEQANWRSLWSFDFCCFRSKSVPTSKNPSESICPANSLVVWCRFSWRS